MTTKNEDHLLLLDPSWSPSEGEDSPPPESVLGAWPLAGDGGLGRFRVNTGFLPLDGDSPSDPVDAGLWLMLHRDADLEQLQLLIRDAVFEVAMNGDGRPLVIKSPDGHSCVVVATAEVHRRRVASPAWRRSDVEELLAVLAVEVDVLFNPGGTASARLIGEFLRAALEMNDQAVKKARARFLEQGVGVLGREPGVDDVLRPPHDRDSAARVRDTSEESAE